MAHRLDGLITNDKFCFTRRSRLKLRPKRRSNVVRVLDYPKAQRRV
jgi:hypothetical protein